MFIRYKMHSFAAESWYTLKKEEKLFNEEEINLLIKKRNEARKNKDFDLADNIRKKLTDMGIEIKDQSNETVWKKV